MGLTPDEIALRSFTPSADGYHQAEVRDFLQRVAAQLRGLQSAMPEGRAELADLTTSLHDHQAQLAAVLAELATATSQMAAAGAQVTAQDVTGEPGKSPTELAQLAEITAEQRAMLDLMTTQRQALTEQLATAQKLTGQQLEASEFLAVAGEQLATVPLPSPPASPAAPASPTISTSSAPSILSATSSAARTPQAPAASAAASSVSPPASLSADETLSLFGSDLDDQPLFSDNAIDLLDGVLDDVMGNLNDEGSQQ